MKKVKSCARQSYKPEDVLAAMRAIWRGMSRRQAAKTYNIPRSTLLDKLDGKRPVDASPGPNPFLTKSEERTLESWAIDLYRRGFPLKTEDLKDMAQNVIQNNQRRTSFKNGRPGRSWMRNFLLRHPRVYEISNDMAPGPRRSRTVTTRDEVRHWCQQHRHFMASIDQESILDFPERVFNVDHGEFLFDSVTGLLLEQERNERLEEKDRPDHSVQADRLSAGVECTSIVATFSAAGGVAPLLFVYPSMNLPQETTDSFPPGCIWTYSESGLLNGKIFLDYIVTFRKWLEQENITLPVLLLVDGRRSRLNMDVTRYCEEQGIILYCLFPTPRPAISEFFSSVLHDSSSSINKMNFAIRVHEALNNWIDCNNSQNLPHTHSILPHLKSMLQTLAEVRAEPLNSLSFLFPPLTNNSYSDHNGPELEAGLEQDESDCEFDYELMPVEGEIEIEFPSSENCDPYSLALHPALLVDSNVPRYLVFDSPPSLSRPEPAIHVSPSPVPPSQNVVQDPGNSCNDCFEDRVDQPDVETPLIVKPLSSPLPETDNGLAKVESEINDVLDTILSMGVSHQIKSEPPSPSSDPPEEPFLGFSPDATVQQKTLDAHGCLRFLETILLEKGLLEEFTGARSEREWNGNVEAKCLFEVWLAANDELKKS